MLKVEIPGSKIDDKTLKYKMESKLLFFYDVGKKVNAIRMLKVEIPR